MSNAFLLKGKMSLRQTMANQTCLLGMDSVELYITHKHSNNLFIISSLFGNSIVIGRELFDRLNKHEVRSLVVYGIHKLKANDSFYASVNTLCFSMFFLPLFILKTLEETKFLKLGVLFKFLADTATYFYFPALSWNQFVMKKVVNHIRFDKEFCVKTDLNHALSSAFFKIEMIPGKSGIKASSFILNQVSILPDINLELGREMNFLHNPFVERYTNIYSKGPATK